MQRIAVIVATAAKSSFSQVGEPTPPNPLIYISATAKTPSQNPNEMKSIIATRAAGCNSGGLVTTESILASPFAAVVK
jgi:hypothetical protein